MKTIRVIVACEESQEVCKAFRERGFEAFSCDIEPCSGGHPEWHFQEDIFTVLAREPRFDLMIAHPPCTHLAVSGMRWFKEGVKPIWLKYDAAAFFMRLAQYDIDHIAVENPICIMSTLWRKPDQIINPYQFGHPEQKKTSLWLKGLPKLRETNNVYDYMMTLPIKERTRIHWLGSNHSKERSKTYHNIAQAMAEQWGDFLKEKYENRS